MLKRVLVKMGQATRGSGYIGVERNHVYVNVLMRSRYGFKIQFLHARYTPASDAEDAPFFRRGTRRWAKRHSNACEGKSIPPHDL